MSNVFNCPFLSSPPSPLQITVSKGNNIMYKLIQPLRRSILLKIILPLLLLTLPHPTFGRSKTTHSPTRGGSTKDKPQTKAAKKVRAGAGGAKRRLLIEYLLRTRFARLLVRSSYNYQPSSSPNIIEHKRPRLFSLPPSLELRGRRSRVGSLRHHQRDRRRRC